MISYLTLGSILLIVHQSDSFTLIQHRLPSHYHYNYFSPLSSQRNENNENAFRDEIINKQIINQIMTNSQTPMRSNSAGSDNTGSNSVIEMTFVGRGSIPLGTSTSTKSSNESITTVPSECLFLTPSKSVTSMSQQRNNPICCIPVPLPTSSAKPLLKLLSFAYKGQPISKSLCLALSPILINRDGSLYDNLPWETWTIENSNTKRNVDAAGNNIDKKYHLGKRDAYNRFMGKDWYGRSVSIGNLAARAKYLLQNDKGKEQDEAESNNTKEKPTNQEEKEELMVSLDENAAKVLAKRVLELEIKESRMAIAEAQEQLAIIQTELSYASNNDFDDGYNNIESMSDEVLIENYDRLQNAIQAVQDAKESLDENEITLENLINQPASRNISDPQGKNRDVGGTNNNYNIQQQQQSEFVSILYKIIESQQSDAPYRGAIGYKPTIDTKEEMFQKSVLPYSSPYELMNEIINEQLNAQVIGCFIENTSLFNGSIILGGALVLKRKAVNKEVMIDGESVMMNDSDDDLGNEGITGGKVIVVECDCDEAIGIALTCGLSISVSSDIWSTSQFNCVVSNCDSDDEIESGETSRAIMDSLPMVEISEEESIVMRTQGDGIMSQGTSIQVPRDYNDRGIGNLFPAQDDRPVFNTDIPVNSLQEYDEMTVADKAQMLLSLDSFEGRLPRPRVLKEAEMSIGMKNDSPYSSTLSPLDELLIPLIDESVRRQIMIREAERRGDVSEIKTLQEDRSMRQRAKECAEEARKNGDKTIAALWEEEAEFYASLRADVTQDEGTYSTFLDRDAWYERDRRKVAERNKKRFGSLFGNDEQ